MGREEDARQGVTRNTTGEGRKAGRLKGPLVLSAFPPSSLPALASGYFFSVRRKATSASASPAASFALYAGILPLPSSMIFFSSASVCFCTSAELKSRSLRLLPMEVSPLPSAPWHMAHFDLKSAAPSAAKAEVAARRMRETTARVAKLLFMESFSPLLIACCCRYGNQHNSRPVDLPGPPGGRTGHWSDYCRTEC